MKTSLKAIFLAVLIFGSYSLGVELTSASIEDDIALQCRDAKQFQVRNVIYSCTRKQVF